MRLQATRAATAADRSDPSSIARILSGVRFAKPWLRLYRKALEEWFNDNVSHLAAALSFYLLFSLAPLVLIVLAIAGAIYGPDAARGELVSQLETFAGPIASVAVQAIVENARQSAGTATVIGVGALLFGATAVFAELQEALNRIWGVQAKPGSMVWNYVRRRLYGFAMVAGIGLLFISFLVGSTILAAMESHMNPLFAPAPLWLWARGAIGLLLTLVLFAAIFRFVPDVELRWRDVWMGAITSALLFQLGRGFLADYLSSSTLSSAYGAAGSLVILLVWVYYSAQIMMFGAELTYVYARDQGIGVIPSPGAIRVRKDSPAA